MIRYKGAATRAYMDKRSVFIPKLQCVIHDLLTFVYRIAKGQYHLVISAKYGLDGIRTIWDEGNTA